MASFSSRRFRISATYPVLYDCTLPWDSHHIARNTIFGKLLTTPDNDPHSLEHIGQFAKGVL